MDLWFIGPCTYVVFLMQANPLLGQVPSGRGLVPRNLFPSSISCCVSTTSNLQALFCRQYHILYRIYTLYLSYPVFLYSVSFILCLSGIMYSLCDPDSYSCRMDLVSCILNMYPFPLHYASTHISCIHALHYASTHISCIHAISRCLSTILSSIM
jgi:hypothetical protein